MKPSTRRLASFAAALVMVICALVVFSSLIRPAYRDSQSIKAEILSKENSLKNEQSAATQVKNLLEQYRGEQSPQNAVSMALPLTNDQAEVVHQAYVLAAANQLSVQSLAVNQPGAKPLNQKSLVKPVGVLGAQARLTGTYANFKNFLKALETNIRLTDIQALVVAPVGNPNQDFYNFDVTFATYHQSS